MKMMEPYLFQWTTFTTVDKGVAFTNLELKYLHMVCFLNDRNSQIKITTFQLVDE